MRRITRNEDHLSWRPEARNDNQIGSLLILHFRSSHKTRPAQKDSNLTDKQKADILRIKSYAKNYSGLLKRKSVNNPEYRFYDEREWRLVPGEDTISNANFSVHPDKYLADKDKYNSKLEKYRILFAPSDISYIIVKETTQIPQMTNFLRSTYSNKCTADELDVLFSKICSTEQIVNDY